MLTAQTQPLDGRSSAAFVCYCTISLLFSSTLHLALSHRRRWTRVVSVWMRVWSNQCSRLLTGSSYQPNKQKFTAGWRWKQVAPRTKCAGLKFRSDGFQDDSCSSTKKAAAACFLTVGWLLSDEHAVITLPGINSVKVFMCWRCCWVENKHVI